MILIELPMLVHRLRDDLQGILEFPTILSVSTATRCPRLESRFLGTLGYTRDLSRHKFNFDFDSPE